MNKRFSVEGPDPTRDDQGFSPTFLEEDPFLFIKPSEYEYLGIIPSDIPIGTIPALRHPSSQIPSRWGGSVYGCGIFEMCYLMSPEELRFLQGISFERPNEIQRHHKKINELYTKIGLLIRYSRMGRPYYLIPVHLVSNSLTHIRAKVEEISKIVSFHKKKYTKEDLVIGALTHKDDLITQDLAIRFKEHRFVPIESLKDISKLDEVLDLVILASDPFEIMEMKKFNQGGTQRSSKKKAEQYVMYLLWKIYGVIKPGGEIFIIAHHQLPRTNEAAIVRFRTEHEAKSFVLFSHLFRTQNTYQGSTEAMKVNISDLQHYVRGRYVEQEVISGLLKGRDVDQLTMEELNSLPRRYFPLSTPAVPADQAISWNKLLTVFFQKIFFKPYIFKPVRQEWESRFEAKGFNPRYMLTYLGQKRAVRKPVREILKELSDSHLSGCPVEFVAEYRDSFDYAMRTLGVIEKLKKGNVEGIPELFSDRLTEPLEIKKRRFPSLNDVIKLSSRIPHLERIQDRINPDRLEGTRTSILQNLEALSLFGFSPGEMRELLLIVLGHSKMGRIVSGKMTEKSLQGLSALAATYSPQQGLNLLRYCTLLTMAEMEASKGSLLSGEQLSELFQLHDSAAAVIINRDIDWNRLLDKEITLLGGTRNKVIKQLLKMIGHFEFLNNWNDLRAKGAMEKEAIADFDPLRLSRLENAIRLVSAVEHFERRFLNENPLLAPAFYRKILDIEFHGTGHLFEQMESNLVLVLLWIAVNVSNGEVINFNPLFSELNPSDIIERVREIENETRGISIEHLGIPLLNQLKDQLHSHGKSFIAGTGFKLSIGGVSQALEISHSDIAKSIKIISSLFSEISNLNVSDIPPEKLSALEALFSELDDFHQSHLMLLGQAGNAPSMPAKQIKWFKRINILRDQIKAFFLRTIFLPDHAYDNLKALYELAPSLLKFIFPEIAALDAYEGAGAGKRVAGPLKYILETLRKLQALIQRKRESFQDIQLLHRVAHKEFGPMATGIVGVSEEQLSEVELIVQRLKGQGILFDAMIKSLVFREIGKLPSLSRSYSTRLNLADIGRATAVLIEKESIAEKYLATGAAKAKMQFLIRHHGLFLHIVRGEYSFPAVAEILAKGSKNLLDALFLQAFVILSSVREELFLEDMAGMLFYMRSLCAGILEKKTTLEDEMARVYKKRGRLFNALEAYRESGLPEGIPSLEKLPPEKIPPIDQIIELKSGRMVFALERLMRLQGIRYVRFADLADSLLNVSTKSIYMKRSLANVGISTFEREIYDARSIYQSLQRLRESTRHFLLEELTGDTVRIMGFERVSGYLTFDNRIKLLLLTLLGVKRAAGGKQATYIDFAVLGANIENRFEAVNDSLNSSSANELWQDRSRFRRRAFSRASGIIFNFNASQRVLTVDFRDRLAVPRRIDRIKSFDDVDKLKGYLHSSLMVLRKYPFYTDDYEVALERAYEKRLAEIIDTMIDKCRKQVDSVSDFRELHSIYASLLNKSWEFGFSEDQIHRLNDIYLLRRDALRRHKILEVERALADITKIDELNDYWEKIVLYLKKTSPYCGKEFDVMIAKRFDAAKAGLEEYNEA